MYKRKIINRTVRIASAAAALTVMGIIFALSAQTGSSSDELSVSFISALFAKEWDAALILNALIRKVAHMTEFAVLAAPVYFFFSTFKISLPARGIVSFCFSALYAVSDEIHQYFVEGRACRVKDIVIDSLGALLCVYVLNIIVKRIIGAQKKEDIERAAPADAVFDIAAAFMCGGKPTGLGIDDGCFQPFAALLREHKLLPVASFVLEGGSSISQQKVASLKNEAFAQIISQENKNAAFLRAYRAMTDAGAMPICLKGGICAARWREPTLRISYDADILAIGRDYQICCEVLEALGYSATQAEGSNVSCYSNSRFDCYIELHCAPFENDTAHAPLNVVVADMDQDTAAVTVDGVALRCPSAQNHLVYLVLHAFKHFINSGIGIRQLMDISLFCADESIDWNTVFEKCAAVSADGFLSAVLLIGNRYFGLDISRITAPAFQRDLDCEMLLTDIKQGGIYGSRNPDNIHSGLLTLNRYVKSQRGERGFLVFLPLAKMKKRYHYLCRFPFLLPVAWVQRAFGYAFSDHSAVESVTIGKKRIQMMQYYGIVK